MLTDLRNWALKALLGDKADDTDFIRRDGIDAPLQYAIEFGNAAWPEGDVWECRMRVMSIV
jgi:hypothetical protein